MDNLVCIVTGANSLVGIGRATVYAFAKKNARVIYATDIFDDHLTALADDIYKTTGVQCIPMRADASSEEDIQAVINDALAKFGRLDVFFANAGIAGRRPMLSETKSDYLDIMSINAWSVHAAIKCASIAMEKTSAEKPESGGSIITTASVAGVRSGAGPVSYCASKAAVINTCQSAAWRLGRKNIRVNAVCPGLIVTEMTKKVLEAISGNEQMELYLNNHSALQRLGDPSEVAAMVAFLAGRESSFITGQDIKVDGGMTAALPYAPLFADE